MSADWTGERVAAPRGSEERFVEDGGKRTPLQADTTIAYPARGGFGEIYRALAMRVPDLRLSQSVRSIDPKTRRLETSDGEVFTWRSIVSTLPLPALLKLLPDVPQAMTQAVGALEALPITLVMIVLEGQARTERQRVYCAEEDVVGHKIVLNHTSSSWLRALPRHGVQVEVSGTRSENDAELSAKALAGLIGMGVIAGAHEVRRTEVVRLPLGYPVPTHARMQVMSELRAWLEERDIHLAGRFAEWAYINSDEALHRGLATGERLAGSA
jgi:protoporphyrinogen oxidase